MAPPTDDTETFEADLKRRQRRMTVFIVLGVLVVAGGLSALFMLLGDKLGNEQVELGRAFLADCSAGRYEAAHERLSYKLRTRIPLAQFKQIVAGDRRLRTYRKMGNSHQSFGKDHNYFEGKLTYDGGSVKAQLFFAKEQGHWKISGLVVGDRDLLSSPLSSPQ